MAIRKDTKLVEDSPRLILLGGHGGAGANGACDRRGEEPSGLHRAASFGCEEGEVPGDQRGDAVRRRPGAKFWPIYKEFETEFTKIGDGIQALVKDYVSNYDRMTPEVADRLATKLLDIEQQRLDLKKKYYARVKGALDAVTATRFLQVENQLEKLLDLQLAAQLPAME